MQKEAAENIPSKQGNPVRQSLEDITKLLGQSIQALQKAMAFFRSDQSEDPDVAHLIGQHGQQFPPVRVQVTKPSIPCMHSRADAGTSDCAFGRGNSAVARQSALTTFRSAPQHYASCYDYSAAQEHSQPTHDREEVYNPHSRLHVELQQTFSQLPRVTAIENIKTSLPRLANTAPHQGLSFGIITEEGGTRVVTPQNAPIDSGANGLFGSVEAMQQHGIKLGTLQATVSGVGGAKACAVSQDPVEITLRRGTPYEVTVREHIFAVEGVGHLFDFLIGFSVMHKLGAILDTNRAILAYPPFKMQGDVNTLAWIPLTLVKQSAGVQAAMAQPVLETVVEPGQPIPEYSDYAFPMMALVSDVGEEKHGSEEK